MVPVHVEFDLTKEDWVTYNLHHHIHSPATRRQKRSACAWAALLILVIWLAVVALSRTPRETARVWWPLLAAGPLAAGLVAVSWQGTLRRTIERHLNEGGNQALLGRKQVTLTPVEITAAGELRSTTARWKAVERIDLTPDYAYVYISAIDAVIVPRRAFASEADFILWVETARTHHAAALS